MFVLDTPNVSPQFAPVMVAQVNQSQMNGTRPERQIGICHPVPNTRTLPPPIGKGENNIDPGLGARGDNIIDPYGGARAYFRLYEQKKIAGTGKVTILQNPMHGELIDEGRPSNDGVPIENAGHNFSYLPMPGFVGKDSAIFLVEVGGFKVKVRYFFQALDHGIGNETFEEACKKAHPRLKQTLYWRIAVSTPPSSSQFTNGNPRPT